MRAFLLLLVAPCAVIAAPPPEAIAVREAREALKKAQAAAVPGKETKYVSPGAFKTGETIHLPPYNAPRGDLVIGWVHHRYFVESVSDKSTCVILCKREPYGGTRFPQISFVIRKTDTSNYADDKEIKPAGAFRVVGTEKIEGRTLFVLEPVESKNAPDKDELAAAIEKAKRDLDAAIAKRDGVIAKEWAASRAKAADAAAKEFPIPKDGTFQEKAVAKSNQEKAVSVAVDEARTAVARKYELSEAETRSLLKK